MTKHLVFLIALLLLALCNGAGAFSPVSKFNSKPPPSIAHHSASKLKHGLFMTATAAGQEATASNKLLKRDRYVATNRFSVRNGKEAKFEARWANRKSRLANCDGFKYFHLMRRVDLQEDGTCTYQGDKDDGFGNYVSFTIWDTKANFGKWRKGEAFKEAHGGTSIGAFVSTMLNSIRVLRTAPKPAFYNGLLVQSMAPETVPTLQDGWRVSENADGTETLPTECFVACNQFFVPPQNAQAFEERWANRESKLKEFDGFIAFMMNRRDASMKGHGSGSVQDTEPTYLSTTIWRDRASFDKWRESQAFTQAHGDSNKKPDSSNEKKSPQGPLWSRPPEPVFYEGTLVITTEEGA